MILGYVAELTRKQAQKLAAEKLLPLNQGKRPRPCASSLITGCRYGELATLKVSAYDVQIGAISLIQGKTRKPKTVFLTDEEAAFFNERTVGKAQDDLIFMRADGEPWNQSNQQPRMKAVLKAAGISRHVRFHDLRHTFATLLAMNGTSMQLIANQLGHSGTRVAEEHYAHF